MQKRSNWKKTGNEKFVQIKITLQLTTEIYFHFHFSSLIEIVKFSECFSNFEHQFKHFCFAEKGMLKLP